MGKRHTSLRLLRTRCEAVIRFIFDALRYRCAYIDLDGCILRRMRCPQNIGLKGIEFLLWWRENLAVCPLIKRRLPLLYLLRLLGVKLVMWTNRDFFMHGTVTFKSLGIHAKLFSEYKFYDGTKIESRVPGPVMDDQKAYLACGKGRGLLVSQL